MSKIGKIVLGVSVAAAAIAAIVAFGPSLGTVMWPVFISDSMSEILAENPHFYDVYKK